MYIYIHPCNIEVDKRIVSCCVPDKQINDIEYIHFKTSWKKFGIKINILNHKSERSLLNTPRLVKIMKFGKIAIGI